MSEQRRTTTGKDYFGGFLESMKGVDMGPGDSAGVLDEDAPPAVHETTLSLAAVLIYLQANGEQTVTQIAAGLKSPILETAELLKTIQTSGLVEVGGAPGEERVALTDAGRTVSAVA